MPKLESFENYALAYDQWFDSHKTEYELELKAIRLFLPENAKGVEIGAGTGRFSQPLGISLGVEPSKSMRDIAIRRGVNMVEGKAESLPIANNAFDYVLFVTTDCFLESPVIAYKEARRILNNGGFIIVAMIDRNSSLGRKYEQTKHESKFYKEATFHSVQEVQADLETAGFKHFEYVQAILPADSDENLKPGIMPGFGKGSFIVIRAQKDATF